MVELTTPVQYVKGIGPKMAEILATKGLPRSVICCIICHFVMKTG